MWSHSFNYSCSHLPVSVPPHTQQSWQSLEEETLYPGGHGVVSSRGTVVDINDKHSNDDGEGDKDHDEEQVFSDKRDHLETEKCNFYQNSLL